MEAGASGLESGAKAGLIQLTFQNLSSRDESVVLTISIQDGLNKYSSS